MHTPNIDFDIIDDLIQFINNDTKFYKEIYYPILRKIEHRYKYNLSIKPSIFEPIVKQAYTVYKDTYDLPNIPSSLNPEDLGDICNKLYQQEIDTIEKSKANDSEASPVNDAVSEEISKLVKLAGIPESVPCTLVDYNDLQYRSAVISEHIKENNITPGSKEWMNLWFPLDTSRFPSGFRGRK